MNDPGATDGDQIGQLLKLAGRRQMPGVADMHRAREAAHAEWAVVVRRRAWRGRWQIGLGALAAAFCALAAWMSLRAPTTPRPSADVATIQRIAGTVLVTSAGMDRQPVTAPGVRLPPGTRIEIGDSGGAALALADGSIVRLDRATVAVIVETRQVNLERGAVYLDAGRTPASTSPLRVETRFGAVRHVGTRFEVRLADTSMRVRVREGSVAVERQGTQWTAPAGEALLFTGAGTPSRHQIAMSGAEWSWVDRLAAPFVLEGATVAAFLDWIGREQGWQWEIADAALRARASRIVLHGSIEGLTPEEALAAVLPAAGLSYRRDGTRVVVSAAPKHGR